MILELISGNTSITTDELVTGTGKSRSTVLREIKKVETTGTIKRIDSDRKGYLGSNRIKKRFNK